MPNPHDDLEDEDGIDTPAESSTAEAVEATGDEQASDATSDGEGEKFVQVPLSEHIAKRRALRDQGEEIARLRAENEGYRGLAETVNQAKPEIVQLVRRLQATEQQHADLLAERERFLEIERLAEEAGVKIPKREQDILNRSIAAINNRLAGLEQLPQQLAHAMQQNQASGQFTQQQLDQRDQRNRLETKFESAWEKTLAEHPELADVEDLAKRRFMEDGGKKPIVSHFPRIAAAAKGGAVRGQVRRQATAESVRPSPADTRAGGGRPANAVDVDMPEGWETMPMGQFLDAAVRMPARRR